MKGTYDSVKLPMTDLSPVFNVSWALVNAHLVGNESAPVTVTAATTLSVGLLAAQVPMPTPSSFLVAVNVAVNRFVADVQLVRDLFWTLVEQQVVFNAVPGHLCDGDGIARASRAPAGSLLSKVSIVASASRVSGDLPVHCTFAVTNALRE